MLRAVADAENEDALAVELVSDDIGRDGHQFASPASRETSAIREVTQTIARFNQPSRHPLCGARVELVDIGADQLEIGECFPRPDYSSHSGGTGFSSGVPQVASQAATSSWSTMRPALMSASARASA